MTLFFSEEMIYSSIPRCKFEAFQCYKRSTIKRQNKIRKKCGDNTVYSPHFCPYPITPHTSTSKFEYTQLNCAPISTLI